MNRVEHQPKGLNPPDGRLEPGRPLSTGSILGREVAMRCSNCAREVEDLDDTHKLCVSCWDAELNKPTNYIILERQIPVHVIQQQTGEWRNCIRCSRLFYVKLYLIKKDWGHTCSRSCSAKEQKLGRIIGNGRRKGNKQPTL